MNTKTKKEIEVGAFLKEYSESNKFDRVEVSVHIDNEFVLKCNPFDIITIYDNFISNVYNLDGIKTDIYIDKQTIKFVSDTYDENKHIEFDRVFDYGYSTTDGGTGIGMFIIKQICKDYKLFVEMDRIEKTRLVKMEIKKE